MTDTKETALAVMTELKIDVTSEFVPFSRSRNKGEKQPSLNWKVFVRVGGREVVTCDYSAGTAHCPAYKTNSLTTKRIGQTAIKKMTDVECETGKPSRYSVSTDSVTSCQGLPNIAPDPVDVVYSLLCDSEAIDSGGFEDWAECYGYDTDSRKAETTYRACIEIGLKLRSALGDDGLKQLRKAFQDY